MGRGKGVAHTKARHFGQNFCGNSMKLECQKERDREGEIEARAGEKVC